MSVAVYGRCGFTWAVRRTQPMDIDDKKQKMPFAIESIASTVNAPRRLHIGHSATEQTTFSTFGKRKLLIKLRNQINGTMLAVFGRPDETNQLE